MAGGNEAQRSDRMELLNHSDVQIRDECEHIVFRQVEAVTALRSRLPYHNNF
ncbi:MAG: hypothetical protein LBC02_08070 [Planctomycetaceae bacterium]|nr:hypothetical protein [Planctomycetaceae bacterium]